MSEDNQQVAKSRYRINYQYIKDSSIGSMGLLKFRRGYRCREFESSEGEVIEDAGKIIGHLRQSGCFNFSLEKIVQKEVSERIYLSPFIGLS